MAFSFGNPSTSGAAPSSTAGPSLFSNQSTTPSSGLSFGNAQIGNSGAGAQPSGGGLFGNPADNSGNTPKPVTAYFSGGGATTTTSSTHLPFGGGGATATPPATSGGGIFGGASKPAGPGMFGSASSTPTTMAGASSIGAAPSLFSAAGQATPTKPPAFGGGLGSTTPAGAPPADTAKPTTGLFGQPSSASAKTPEEPSKMFGGGAAKPSSIPFGGGSSATPSAQPAASSSGTPGLFGSGTAGTPAAPASTANPLFGNASTGAASSTLSSNIFGGGAATPKPADAAASKPASTTGSNSLFGAKPAATTAPASGTTSNYSFVAKPAATTATSSTPSFFGGGATPAATSAPAKTPSLFEAATASAPAASTSTAAPSLFGKPATTSAPAASHSTAAPGLFGNTTTTSAPASTGTTAGTTGASTTATAGPEKTATPSNMSASTMGPPSQLPRLKNKTMDEIITRWATDLQKYQKEFKDQATKVAAWDRLLVENGEKIQKLYLQTHDAEKASNEIDRQLQAVESHQSELESFLDRYEKEVDDLYTKQVGGSDQLGGPDQERERTYKVAENLTDRLDEMGKDLGKMITEINDISGSLSKGNKPDDPLSQIVRVLNGHLQQLQWVDTNAAALQAKVNAAQKDSNSMGSKFGNPDSDAADSFYRSYMGRR
ncbi:Nucleoporin nsp1 [Cytospora mali]|uniref:Nucleoporin NSP1 n=1 Tax=Cytospora mali TaxID=578113 RepID=A0A194VUK4_CYTMA|nr:Nucleoporin nsp1 [Valsa mali]